MSTSSGRTEAVESRADMTSLVELTPPLRGTNRWASSTSSCLPGHAAQIPAVRWTSRRPYERELLGVSPPLCDVWPRWMVD